MKAVFVALFAGMVGCAFVQPVSAAQGSEVKEKVLHSFGSGTDDQNPYAGLIYVKGMLYGASYSGGGFGLGTVFALKP